jgi:hypothetical protein
VSEVLLIAWPGRDDDDAGEFCRVFKSLICACSESVFVWSSPIACQIALKGLVEESSAKANEPCDMVAPMTKASTTKAIDLFTFIPV